MILFCYLLCQLTRSFHFSDFLPSFFFLAKTIYFSLLHVGYLFLCVLFLCNFLNILRSSFGFSSFTTNFKIKLSGILPPPLSLWFQYAYIRFCNLNKASNILSLWLRIIMHLRDHITLWTLQAVNGEITGHNVRVNRVEFIGSSPGVYRTPAANWQSIISTINYSF